MEAHRSESLGNGVDGGTANPTGDSIMAEGSADLEGVGADANSLVTAEHGTLIPHEGEAEANSISRTPATTHWLRALSWRGRTVLLIVCLAGYCESAVYSCLAPFFPLEATKRGATDTQIALIIGIFQLVVFLVSPVFGKYVTHFGAKFLFVCGLIVCGYSMCVFGILQYCPPGSSYVASAFAIRIVEAVGGAAYLTAAFAIIAREFPEQVSTVFGLGEMMSGLGYLSGPLVGSLLYQLAGFKMPFLVLGALEILCGFLAWYLLPSQTDILSSEYAGTWKLLRMPRMIISLVSIFSALGALGFLTATFADQLDKQHLATYAIALIFILPSLAYIVSAPLAGYLSDKKNMGVSLMAVGSLIITGAFIVVGPSPFVASQPTVWTYSVGGGLLGVGVALGAIPCFDIGLKTAIGRGFSDDYHTYGLVSGVIGSAIALATFVGAALGGLFVENYGFALATTGASGVSLVLAVIIVGFLLYERILAARLSHTAN
ncbi:MFS-type transporter SLC18B1-like [Paramacrobiotus metropolitanus]|uniref:MFS-type transporter SLC18B1-like n=1 Tax=Paramacrobiotus metropolitanus TaxID=2943436 RepID=UPI002446425B|nr:MFS-type transporter SLC18B1-like [Paramacrobiotus metropolitanus]